MTDYQLSPQQFAVISALSSGVNMTDAAEQAGIHRNTINVWRRNSRPFQHALADAQYDRALLYRERAEALTDRAVETIHELLSDPKTPPSMRLKAALAIIQLATTPPPPKKQIELLLETPGGADFSRPTRPEGPSQNTPEAPSQNLESVHNSAQSEPTRGETPPPSQKTGRNETCPCGSG